MFSEIILTREELTAMFKLGIIVDSGHGWIMYDEEDDEFFFEIDIIALHEVNPKYINNITNSKLYKIVPKKRI